MNANPDARAASPAGSPAPLFHEEQRFRQPWLLTILYGSMLLNCGVFLHGVWRQIVLGRPWGDRPMSDLALLVTGGTVLLFNAGIVYFFRKMRLDVTVQGDGIHVRFVPFVRRVIRFDEIEEARARDYNPLREYGGWGLRFGPSGTAYNMSGRRGVQLVLRQGKGRGRRLLLGSPRADELAEAIERARRGAGG